MDRDIGDKCGRDEAAGRQTSYRRVESTTGKMSPRWADLTVEHLESVALLAPTITPELVSGSVFFFWSLFGLENLEVR